MPKRTDLKSILIIGAGPIVIGQACEFDYSGTQACKALKEEGYRVILVNSNPATIMTDPEFADRTYIEPITPECVEKIIIRELAEIKRLGISQTLDKLVLLPTLGGQTALNTAMSLHRSGTLKKHGVEMIGANAIAIEKGEDRQIFKDLMLSIGLDVPISGTAHNMDEARAVADKIGRMLLVDTDALMPFWTWITHAPVLAYLELNHTLVLGGIVLSLLLALPVYILTVQAVNIYRKIFRERMNNWRIVKWFQGLSIVRLISSWWPHE